MMTDLKLFSPDGEQYPVGVGLKSVHYQDVLSTGPAVNFFEVHAENYMLEEGPHHRFLEAITDRYPLSIHGVGMSLGSADGLSGAHLKKFREVTDRYQPWLVSEHLAWSVADGHYLNDLLPLPFNEESLEIVTQNVNCLQDYIGRSILVENPSSYMAFENSTMTEVEFLKDLVDRTGCGLLLDVNNIFVSGRNMNWDPLAYLKEVPAAAVGEIHLAGHLVKNIEGVELRIDDHGSRVHEDVWQLYRDAISGIGPRPTLVEWDTNIPSFDVLIDEAEKARQIMKQISISCGSVEIDHA